MAIALACACGKKLSARDELAGRKIKCPGCGALLKVPVPSAVIEEMPEKPKVSEDRVLTGTRKDWEQDRGFGQILVEMLYKPGATLEVLSAYVGKPSVVLGMLAVFGASLIPAGLTGYFEIQAQAERMRQAQQAMVSVPGGGPPPGLGSGLQMMQEAQKERDRAAWESEKASWARENQEIGRFPAHANYVPVRSPYMITISAQPRALIEGDPFTITVTLKASGKAGLPETLAVRLAPRADRFGRVSPQPPQTGSFKAVSPGEYQYTAAPLPAGLYTFTMEAPGTPPFSYEEKFGVGAREPPASLRTMPPELARENPAVGPAGPPAAVTVGAFAVGAGLSVVLGIAFTLLELLIAVALVELASRLFGSGSEFLFMAATLAFVSGITNFAGVACVPPYALGRADLGFGVSWAVKLYGVFLYILAIGKVYHMSAVEAIATAVIVFSMKVAAIYFLAVTLLGWMRGG